MNSNIHRSQKLDSLHPSPLHLWMKDSTPTSPSPSLTSQFCLPHVPQRHPRYTNAEQYQQYLKSAKKPRRHTYNVNPRTNASSFPPLQPFLPKSSAATLSGHNWVPPPGILHSLVQIESQGGGMVVD